MEGYIQGESISGTKERIYPRVIWEPEQPDTQRQEIHFTELVKGVSNTAKADIIKYGGFKGNVKRYDQNEEGNYLSARFSWWSVYIPQDEIQKLEDNLSEGEELAAIYEPSSRYGTNVFHLGLDQLLSDYAECCGNHPEIRKLGTYVYKREVMHAYVVVPKGNDIFNEHPFVDDDYFGKVQPYLWRPFSVIKWDNNANAPKERMWAHQAFAFFLDPLPDKIMLVPEVEDKTKWKICLQSKINLVTPHTI